MSQFGIRYAQGLKVLPILGPIDIVATATATQYVDMDELNWLTVLCPFGVVTSTDSTGEIVVTVEASTAGSSNGTEGAIAFQYRLSAAVATDTMGAIGSATSAGVAVANTADNTLLVIEIDPAVVSASADTRRYVRVVFTPTSETTVCIVGAIAVGEPRYPGNSIPSSTQFESKN